MDSFGGPLYWYQILCSCGFSLTITVRDRICCIKVWSINCTVFSVGVYIYIHYFKKGLWKYGLSLFLIILHSCETVCPLLIFFCQIRILFVKSRFLFSYFFYVLETVFLGFFSSVPNWQSTNSFDHQHHKLAQVINVSIGLEGRWQTKFLELKNNAMKKVVKFLSQSWVQF